MKHSVSLTLSHSIMYITQKIDFKKIELSAANDLLDNADEVSERVRITNYAQCVELLYVANGAYEYAIVVTYDNANDNTVDIVADDAAIYTRAKMRTAYQVELSAYEDFQVEFCDVLKAFYPFALTLV